MNLLVLYFHYINGIVDQDMHLESLFQIEVTETIFTKIKLKV